MLRRTIAGHGGREVSNAGDGLMVVFTESVVAAISCAMEMHAGMAALAPDDPAQLYVGISMGEVAQDGDNYSGMPIVEAARLESAAKPGQTLANAVVRAVVGTRRSIRFRDMGNLQLKGIPEPLPTVEIITDDVIDNTGDAVVAPETAPRRRRGPLVAIAAVVVIALIAGAVALVTRGSGSHASTTSAPTQPAAQNYPVHLTKATCPADSIRSIPGLTCETLTVPEDRSKPDGRVVKLGVFHAPARTQPAAADAVVDFGADDLATSPARDKRDEYQLGNRGFGDGPGSTPSLTCPEYTKVAGDALVKPSGDSGQRTLEAAALRSCHDRWSRSVDLNQYNSLNEGDDMADLIRALHLSHVNLVSGYVATISALEVTRQLPGVVRSITLQDAIPGEQSQFSDPTGTLSKAFNSYVTLCKQDSTCNSSYPNLDADLKRDYQVYSASPRIVHGDDGNEHAHDVLLDGPRVGQAVAGSLSDPGSIGLLAAGIAAKDRSGEIDTLTAGRVIAFNQSDLDPTYSWAAEMSYTCSYELYTFTPGRTLSDQAVPELAGVDDTDYLASACKSWPVEKLAEIAFDDPHTDVPTFLVSGNLAPSADQAWPAQVQGTLATATVAVFPTLNAAVLSNNQPRCLGDLRRQFLANPESALDTGACTRQSPAIQFVANG